MSNEQDYERWAADAGALHELAQHLLPQMPIVEVRLPRAIADRAVAAWQRDSEPGGLTNETHEQQTTRHDAATFALIGQSIEETGVEADEDVVFRLDAWVLGNALEAADRAGRLDVFPPPEG